MTEGMSVVERACNICGYDQFSVVDKRSDGRTVLGCQRCRMGILKEIPDDLSVFYEDSYYVGDDTVGYQQYELMAEHGTAWAAALVECLKPSGSILDIGCVDGALLKRLGEQYCQFGIEVNESMASRAEAFGVQIIAHDIFSKEIPHKYSKKFDIVTSIAVFEHLRDFRRGVEICLSILKDDGVLLFEVPLISETNENKVWFSTSLEHVYYPTISGLKRLFEVELGLDLVGGEVFVRDYASTFVGIVSKSSEVTAEAAKLYDRLAGQAEPLNDKERVARLHFQLVHGANSKPELVQDLESLPAPAFTEPLLHRLRHIWSADLQKLQRTSEQLSSVKSYADGLLEARDYHAAQATRAEAVSNEAKAEYKRARGEVELASARNRRLEAEMVLKAAEVERARSETALAQVRFERSEMGTAALQDRLGRTIEEKKHAEAELQQASAELDRLTQLAEDNEKEAASAQRELELRNNKLADIERELELRSNKLADLEREIAHLSSEFRASEVELVRYRAVVERLAAGLSTVSNDRQLNVAQMVNSMTHAESRCQAAIEHALALQQERDAAWARLVAIQNSNIWKATLPVQQFAQRFPGFARALRTPLKLTWKALGLRSRLGGVIRQQSDALNALRSADVSRTALAPANPGTPQGPVQKAAEASQHEASKWDSRYPLVSIVIPCFNYGHFVRDAIESALAQTFTDIEIIVVEGGSSSLESRRQLAELNYPKMRVLLQDGPRRAGANRNFGIQNARGKYICCLDADDKIDPTYIEKAVFLLEHYEYDVVSTKLQFFGNNTDMCGILEQPVLEDMLRANHVLTCAVFRRALWAKAGGIHDFNEPGGHVHEDWAFWVRLAALGARFFNLNGEALFYYRSHGVSLSSKSVLPDDKQIEAIAAFNAEILNQSAIDRSRKLALESRRAQFPLQNIGRYAVSTRPSLLIALPFLIIGGAERLLSAISEHLARQGWKIVIVTTIPVGPEHGDATSWFAEATQEIYHLPRFLAPDRWEDFIHYLFAAKNIDLLWMVGSAFVYDMTPAIKESNPRLAIVDLLFNTIGHTANNRKHAKAISLNLVENQEVRDWLLARGEQANRIKVMESGVDLERHAPRDKAHDMLSALGIPEDAFIVGFSGRWSEEKDPLGFVEIARLTQASHVVFLMTGTGHMRERIEAAIAEACFPAGRFHLVGPVADVAPYIASYDLLCLNSTFDGRPVVVLEALAMGVPVLASRVGALPELVEDGVSGCLLSPGDYAGFARCIEQIASEPGRLGEMKRKARERAESKLDARKMMNEYEETLLGVITAERGKDASIK